ncbi:hypothetical protein [Mesobacillus maritimus]|uniref:Uncharacterized protein n=1 Tax=Mesobacillus maritimus TaxID=1643336 RepID=A0ABS7K8R7_9BACI|nr:hypothetical protein [Mesobacillus maritimus]MBY0098666.1 hypothetical protein [Mesobacillus maritimus]
MKKNDQIEIISEEEIYEPTGKFQQSGREVIYTRKTIMRKGKYTISVKSNEPSPEAIKNFNRMLNQRAKEILFRNKGSDY